MTHIPILDFATTKKRCWCVVATQKDKPSDCFVTIVPFYETKEQAMQKAQELLKESPFFKTVLLQSVDIIPSYDKAQD